MGKSFFRRPPFVVAAALVLLFVALDAGIGAIVIEREPHRPNLYYHHGLKPNLSMTTRWGRAYFPLFTNDLGLKDRAVRQVARAGGHRRILFLGDSFVEGLGVAYESTFVGIVGDRIRGDGSEAFNGGCLSHSPRLYLLHLQDLVDRRGLHVDEVVVFIDISDVADELTYEDFTPGKLSASFALRELMYFARDHSLLGYAIFSQLPRLRSAIDAVKSWISAPARDGRDDFNSRAAWVDNDEALRAWGEKGLQLARDNLRRLVAYAHGKGITVSFAIYPWPRLAQRATGRARDVWRKMAAEENWALVDLFEDFAATPDAAARFFIRGDIHWNALGHQFVAERWMAHYCAMRQASWCARRAP